MKTKKTYKVKGITLIEIIVIACIVLVVLAIVVPPIMKVCNERTVTVTVTGKEVKRYSKSSDIYLVFTDDTTYSITDSLLKGRWDSSDLYGKIEIGKTYNMTIAGYRIPILSEYPNIYEIRVVE